MSLVQERKKKRPFVDEKEVDGVDLSTLSLSEDRPRSKKSRSSLPIPDSIGDDMALDLAVVSVPSSNPDSRSSELPLAENESSDDKESPPRIPAFLLDPSSSSSDA